MTDHSYGLTQRNISRQRNNDWGVMLKHLRRCLVALTAALVLSTPFVAAPASAFDATNDDVTIQRIDAWQNRATGACMDDSAEGLRAFPCNGLRYQQWNTYIDLGSGLFVIQSIETGECLDDSVEYGLRTITCSGDPHQLWLMSRTDVDGGVFMSNNQTRRCVDDSVAGLRPIPCNYLPFQQWDPSGGYPV